MNHIAKYIANHTTYQARKLQGLDNFQTLGKLYSLDDDNLDSLAKALKVERKDLDIFLNVFRKFLNI